MSITARDRKILAVLAVLAVVAVYWLLLLGPKREEATEAAQELTEQEERRDTAEAMLAELQTARQSFETDYATVVRLGKALPTEVDVPSLMVQLEDAAHGAGIAFDSITVGERTAVATATAPTPDGTEPAPAPADGSAPATPAEPASSSTTAPSTDPTAATAAAAPSLEGVALDFSFRGDFFELADLFHELKRYVNVRGDRIDVEGRLMTIDNLVLEPTEEGSDELTAEITATAYLAPVAEGPTAGATPAGPAAPAPATQPAGEAADGGAPAPPPATGTAASGVTP